MANFNAPTKVFIRTKNDINKIINNYNISLIIYAIVAIITNFLINNKALTISYIKSLLISLFLALTVSYMINIIKKEYEIKKILIQDCVISIAIIISLFAININIYIHAAAILIAIIIKNIFKKINISASLYGILVISLYKYLTNTIEVLATVTNKNNIINILIDLKYICPLLSIIAFIYLFQHKSIKYNLVFSYITTFTLVMLIYGLLNDFNLYYSLQQLLNSGIILLSVYTLTDYKITPVTSEGNIVYGIIVGIVSAIMKFIIPNTAILLVFILAPTLTKIIDKISPKLKYNNKLYIGIVISSIALMILTSITLKLIF